MPAKEPAKEKERTYFNALVGWALACLKPGKRAAKPDRRGAERPVASLAARFGLSPLEQRVIALALAAERSIEVARAARALAGSHARGLTVEVARAALADPGVDAALAPSRPLRRHGLVTVDGDGELRLSPGLSARLCGEEVDFGPGVWRLEPGREPSWAAVDPPAPGAIALARQDLLPAAGPLLATLEGCGRREALGLALALARGGRPVIAADIEALPPAGRAELVAALRREADLDGTALVLLGAAALGEGWRAAATPSPAAPLRPPLVVIADPRPREIVALDGLELRALKLPVLAEPSRPPARPGTDDGFEQIRQQAVRDAERALGIRSASPPSPPSPPPPSSPPSRAEAPASPSRAAVSPPTTAPPAVVSPSTTTPTETPTPATEPAPPAAKLKRSKKGMQYFGDPDAQPVSRETPAAPPSTAPAGGEPAPLEVPAGAAVDVLARLSTTSPSPTQRIQLISEIAGVRNAAVVAALRANVKSEHPGVRAAAEAAMARLFGPDWNRLRPVPKPIQPPRSDHEAP